jgi:hypothetical protein
LIYLRARSHRTKAARPGTIDGSLTAGRHVS